MRGDYDDSNWHLDKRVPIALIFTLVAQFGFGIWWVSKISNRVDNLELQMTTGANLPTEISVVKEQLKSISKSVDRIESVLDKQIDLDRRVK
jgi:hypothetical protein